MTKGVKCVKVYRINVPFCLLDLLESCPILMATMYPQKLPKKIKSRAEHKLFNLFRYYLSEDYTIIWSIDWLFKHPLEQGGRVQESEIDFVILHPQHGILVLEVKGGGVSYNGLENQFFTRDLNHQQHPIRDPFRQVRDNTHALYRELTGETSPLRLRQLCRQACFAQGVVFPNISATNLAHRPTLDEMPVLDRNDVKAANIQTAVERAYRYWQKEATQPLGTRAVKQIVKIYASTWNIRPPMVDDFENEEAQLQKLTESQFAVLDVLSRKQRVAISGCAGSGKTFLAVEQARRLARRGLKVLLVCYNRNLADWLRGQLALQAHTEPELGRNIEVSTFHSLAAAKCRKADIELTQGIDRSNRRQVFNQEYPQKLIEAARRLPDAYDAIIVDEGQDFGELHCTALLALLRSQTDSTFHIFYDENQRIHSNLPNYPVPASDHYPLHINCRNTRKIHKLVMQYTLPNQDAECKGPAGHEVECVEIGPNDGDAKRKLGQLIKRLTEREQIPLRDIVLLVPMPLDRRYRRNFFKGDIIGEQFVLSDRLDTTSAPDALTLSYIQTFKGLERKVVILAELERLEPDKRQKLLYIALSRAKLHLIILGNFDDSRKNEHE